LGKGLTDYYLIDATLFYFIYGVADTKDSTAAGQADTAKTIKGKEKNHVKVGGWSQQRYERRRDKEIHHYSDEIVNRLKELNTEKAFDRIVLVGGKEILNGDKGILIFISTGGDYSPEGKLASPVQLAFLTDGDKLIGRLPQLQISSNLFDMYGNAFRGASSDTLYPDSFENYLVFNMKTSKL